MPRRPHASRDSDAPPVKKSSGTVAGNIGLKQGDILKDNIGKRWKLGKPVGVGGFGEIYDVSDNVRKRDVTGKARFVAKIEKHSNGPLFVEINCYLRLCKLEKIGKWKMERGLDFLGMPHFVASGSHFKDGDRYRFLIIPKYSRDLERIFQERKRFNLKTVLVVARQIVDILEYIHSHGYVHSDIKASNIMLGEGQHKSTVSTARKMPTRKLRNIQKSPVRVTGRTLRTNVIPNYLDDIPFLDDILNEYENSNKTVIVSRDKGERVFLLDYGLASKYVLSDGSHKEFSSDQRKAHAGTLLFCSRDAHKGVTSRRSDLESLGYNILYWLTGSLPWMNNIHEPEVVEKKKDRCFGNVQAFLDDCFEVYPRCLLRFFNYLNELKFEETPNYNFCRSLFRRNLKECGYSDDLNLDFDGAEDSTVVMQKIIPKSTEKIATALFRSPCVPLDSNIIFQRPKLRKKIKDKYVKMTVMNWSRILIDPETILKQAAQKKSVSEEPSPGVLEIDLEAMNPTPAMRDVYERAYERGGLSPPNNGLFELTECDRIDGYTAEMMKVHRQMVEHSELQLIQRKPRRRRKRRAR
ncbi:serine/threonine-protein kinase VRK1-like [Cylas formicarius]|uniref:serine/threonine-protein kinase VRK1-like n=1 Tax=Cylas formicarius TaxID=197179 RepID=UPI0029588F08|nr:serine/threonine-protein kinase VRK1-like [Cylas formicarius]XP_060520665.1 serine/threonine-protein kinase VRK1-like [Cylas formicarius]XP_060520666.1 serine/threonine-protein kinase VRK1-like [Cylas formicarius]